jgi:hypothetical protein
MGDAIIGLSQYGQDDTGEPILSYEWAENAIFDS